jgi:hypothetical protein
MRIVPAATLLTLIALLLFACGGSDDDPATTPAPPEDEPTEEITGDASPADVQVIDDWAKTLKKGDVKAAAEFFALPSTAENGLTYDIRSRADARLFNESLPCGAELKDAQTEGDFTTATFELTERPGPGTCGTGVGAEAQTAFVIEKGKIVEWRRVATSDAQPAPGDAV